jgi:OOP family OmpA-OmpF porin
MSSRIQRFQFFFLVFTTSFATAQNLVPNPGFENFIHCPGGYSQAPHEFRVPDWASANLGTPDYFNACSRGEADVPNNWAGTSDAYEGLGFAGIFLIVNNGYQYQEYLQSKLLEPLLKDSAYHIEFHYKLSSYSRFSVNRIGLLLTDSMIVSKADKYLNLKPTLDICKDSALTTETGLWEKASMTYQARGGERYVTIGNFYSNEQTKQYKIEFRPMGNEMLEIGSYYYVDGVKVIPKYILDQQEKLVPEFSIPTAKTNTNYVLRNIQFQLNSYKLIPPSFEELDALATYLRANSKFKIQVFGHTDDQGSDNYNLKLSENRAATVAFYLIQAGVDKSRIEKFGYGERQPLMDGTSDIARSNNRRVEIRFIE